jgi:putative redox protein
MPDIEAEVRWEGGSLLSCTAGGITMPIDWDSRTAASPVQALVFALAGCMAADVVLILQKGREPITGLDARITADRAEKPPRRLLRVDIAFSVAGDVTPEKVERAIRLSRETYCSVWHSLAPDIAFTTSFEVNGSR